MGQIDTFGLYVRRRLEHWGEVFALAKDCDYLGHQSKNMLQVLIDHRGEMPERTQGFKPLEVDDQAMQIEVMVSDVARTDLPMACVLRGFYCGSGRRKVERWEQANWLLQAQMLRPVSVRSYLATAELGFERIRGRLEGFSMAA